MVSKWNENYSYSALKYWGHWIKCSIKLNENVNTILSFPLVPSIPIFHWSLLEWFILVLVIFWCLQRSYKLSIHLSAPLSRWEIQTSALDSQIFILSLIVRSLFIYHYIYFIYIFFFSCLSSIEFLRDISFAIIRKTQKWWTTFPLFVLVLVNLLDLNMSTKYFERYIKPESFLIHHKFCHSFILSISFISFDFCLHNLWTGAGKCSMEVIKFWRPNFQHMNNNCFYKKEGKTHILTIFMKQSVVVFATR